jgi:hypothetical protein
MKRALFECEPQTRMSICEFPRKIGASYELLFKFKNLYE